MKRICCVWVVVCAARIAAAQTPGEVAPTTAPFLEKRVPDELASEGVLLSRRNLALQVEQLGDKWLVSLVDLSTSRVAASTKVDVLPPDREAAVAAMTHVVADLAAQIDGRPAEPLSPAPVVGLIDDRAERAAHEVAEAKFKRDSIHFGIRYSLVSGSMPGSGNMPGSTFVSLVPRWVAYQGELDREMSPDEFYTAVGRPDLGHAYQSRRSAMIGGFVAGSIVAAIGMGIAFSSFGSDCKFDDPGYEDCRNSSRDTMLAGLAVMGVGSIGFGIGYWFWAHPHPIEESEAKDLADSYNQQLRGQLGLPVVRRDPVIRDLRIAPRISNSNSGLVLSGRF